MIKRLIAAALLLASTAAPTLAADAPTPAPAAPAGYYTFQKVVYQNDSGWPNDRSYFFRLIGHINAHIEATGGQVDIRVVSFSTGLKMFVLANTDPDLAAAIDGLRAKGVHFDICRNTMQTMHLKPAELYGVHEEDVVPSGVAEIARLQGLGYVFEHP